MANSGRITRWVFFLCIFEYRTNYLLKIMCMLTLRRLFMAMILRLKLEHHVFFLFLFLSMQSRVIKEQKWIWWCEQTNVLKYCSHYCQTGALYDIFPLFNGIWMRFFLLLQQYVNKSVGFIPWHRIDKTKTSNDDACLILLKCNKLNWMWRIR